MNENGDIESLTPAEMISISPHPSQPIGDHNEHDITVRNSHRHAQNHRTELGAGENGNSKIDRDPARDEAAPTPKAA